MARTRKAERFVGGQLVVLTAVKSEGWPATNGQIVAYSGNGTWLVQVEPEDSDDDGLREVDARYIRPAKDRSVQMFDRLFTLPKFGHDYIR